MSAIASQHKKYIAKQNFLSWKRIYFYHTEIWKENWLIEFLVDSIN